MARFFLNFLNEGHRLGTSGSVMLGDYFSIWQKGSRRAYDRSTDQPVQLCPTCPTIYSIRRVSESSPISCRKKLEFEDPSVFNCLIDMGLDRLVRVGKLDSENLLSSA